MTHRRARGRLAAGAAVLAVLACAEPPQNVPPPPEAEVSDRVDDVVAQLIADSLTAARNAPADAGRRAALGMAYEVNGLFEAALQCYEQAQQLDPSEPRYSYYAALTRTHLGDLEGALRALSRTLELEDGYVPAHLYHGSWLLDLGRTDEAAAAFRRATELEPDNPAGWVGLARVHLDRAETAEAVEILERWIRRAPQPYLYQLLGQAYRQQGDLDRARQMLARAEPGARPRWPDPWVDGKSEFQTGTGATLDRAEALLEEDRYVEAIELLESLRASGTSGVTVFSNLALAYNRTGQMDKAFGALRSGVETHPDFYPFRLMISAAYHSMGELEPALEHLDRAIELDADAVEPHARRATILYQSGRRAEARDAYDAALARGSDDPGLLMAAAALELQLGSWQGAADRAQQAVRLDPQLAPGWIVLGMARGELGRLPAAREALERAAALQPNAPLLQQARGRLAQLERGR